MTGRHPPGRNPIQEFPRASPSHGDEPRVVELPRLLGFVRRHLLLIAAIAGACVALGLAYAFTAPPVFTAQASLLIDGTNERLSSVANAPRNTLEDVAAVETQLQLLRSQRVALAVVRELDLADEPAFLASEADVVTAAAAGAREGVRRALQTIVGLVNPAAEAPVEGDATMRLPDAGTSPEEEKAVAQLVLNTSVRRAGASHVVEVAYDSPDPVLSARIANALTLAYIADRREARYEAADEAATWMQGRIDQLRAQLNDAARAAQAFRAEHDLVAVGAGGALVAEQQLSELNARLVEARVDGAEALARLNSVRSLLDADGFDMEFAEAVEATGNLLLPRLREQYVATQNRLADVSSRYGLDHPTVRNAREEMERLQQAMREELRRIAATLRSNHAVARDRVAQIEDELDRLVDRAKANDAARVELEQLETIADAYRATYESYLDRYTQILQEQTAPVLEARLITPATVPAAPSAPRKGLILVLSAILGGALGFAAAILAASFDRSVRLPRQLEEIGVPCLAVVPSLRASTVERLGFRKGARRLREMAVVREQPLSEFATGLRRAKTALAMACRRPDRPAFVIGITSAGAGEGKSTVASNLAQIFARAGSRTLLVDGDLHAASISDALSRGGKARFDAVEVLAAERLRRLLQSEEGDGEAQRGRLAQTASPSDLLASERMGQVIAKLRETYECVIVDLPPVEAVPDANAVASLLDTMLLVCRWGRTPVEAVESAARSIVAHQGFVVGAVLNRADLCAMRILGYRPAGPDYLDYGGRPDPRGTDATAGAQTRAFPREVSL